MNKEKINLIIEEQYNFLINKYNEKQIVGIFVYGLGNYGLAENEDEIKTMACICPDFNSLCCFTDLDSYYIQDDKNRDIRIVDIRKAYRSIINQESLPLEGCFTEFRIINPRYERIFNKYILMNREYIFHCNQELRIMQAVKIGKNALDNYKKTKSNLSLLKAAWIRIALNLYLNGTSCENCVNLKQDYYKQYLLSIKHGELIPQINEIEEDFNETLKKAESLIEETDCSDLVRNCIVEIVKIAITDLVQTKDFYEILTKKEKDALNIILQNLNENLEGNISISQLIEISNFSRPVFKNTLQKMKEYKIAEIENQGVKGLYIKIIDGSLLSK